MTVVELIACGIQPTQAKAFAPHLTSTFERFKIDTSEQRAAFIAQACHESRNFTRLEESLYYTTVQRLMEMWPSRFASVTAAKAMLRRPEALANTVYSNWLGNGDYASGDGWRYRGRGLFGLTGLDNYRVASEELGRDYVRRPELVAQPEDAALTAGWFWSKNGCNALMLRGLFDQTTRKINRAMVGQKERRLLYADVRAALRQARMAPAVTV